MLCSKNEASFDVSLRDPASRGGSSAISCDVSPWKLSTILFSLVRLYIHISGTNTARVRERVCRAITFGLAP